MTPPTLLLIGSSDRTATLRHTLKGSRIPLSGEINHASSLRLVPHVESDVIIVDGAAAEMNLMTLLPWLAEIHPTRRVVVLGTSGSQAEARLLRELGADEVIAPEESLVSALARWGAPPLVAMRPATRRDTPTLTALVGKMLHRRPSPTTPTASIRN